ncbi:MAG TPA: nucleotidyltransferase family protein [Candidatus Limnocylindrales bacterium]|nr:nucleotidyltransferase family protein [Candidatus Limnocylindrales bacterium]
MKAMVLAAGLGTRLRPLTDHQPKALVEIDGRTLLEITLTRLRDFGVREVIINVHHFVDTIEQYLHKNDNFGLRIELSREEVLLDTGGGLKKAGWFFLEGAKGSDEPFLLHNVDVISTIDFGGMVTLHKKNAALATLAVQERETSRQLLFNEKIQLCGRRAGWDKAPEIARPSANLKPLAFTGIHCMSPRLLTFMTEDGAFSIIDTYLRLAAQGELIQGFRADEFYWRDLGKLEQVQQAAQDYKNKRFI